MSLPRSARYERLQRKRSKKEARRVNKRLWNAQRKVADRARESPKPLGPMDLKVPLKNF